MFLRRIRFFERVSEAQRISQRRSCTLRLAHSHQCPCGAEPSSICPSTRSHGVPFGAFCGSPPPQKYVTAEITMKEQSDYLSKAQTNCTMSNEQFQDLIQNIAECSVSIVRSLNPMQPDSYGNAIVDSGLQTCIQSVLEHSYNCVSTWTNDGLMQSDTRPLLGLIGESGSGKTTILKRLQWVLERLLSDRTHTVFVDGAKLMQASRPHQELMKHVSTRFAERITTDPFEQAKHRFDYTTLTDACGDANANGSSIMLHIDNAHYLYNGSCGSLWKDIRNAFPRYDPTDTQHSGGEHLRNVCVLAGPYGRLETMLLNTRTSFFSMMSTNPTNGQSMRLWSLSEMNEATSVHPPTLPINNMIEVKASLAKFLPNPIEALPKAPNRRQQPSAAQSETNENLFSWTSYGTVVRSSAIESLRVSLQGGNNVRSRMIAMQKHFSDLKLGYEDALLSRVYTDMAKYITSLPPKGSSEKAYLVKTPWIDTTTMHHIVGHAYYEKDRPYEQQEPTDAATSDTYVTARLLDWVAKGWLVTDGIHHTSFTFPAPLQYLRYVPDPVCLVSCPYSYNVEDNAKYVHDHNRSDYQGVHTMAPSSDVVHTLRVMDMALSGRMRFLSFQRPNTYMSDGSPIVVFLTPTYLQRVWGPNASLYDEKSELDGIVPYIGAPNVFLVYNGLHHSPNQVTDWLSEIYPHLASILPYKLWFDMQSVNLSSLRTLGMLVAFRNGVCTDNDAFA